jgi:hypothetical protein
MPDTINGLPAHILLVHAVIVLIPLAALMLIVSAVWPMMRSKLGVLTPLVALVALISVPITTGAGEWLRDHLPAGAAESPLVRKHTELGDTLLPWAIGVFVIAAAVWWIFRRGLPPKWVTIGLAVVAIAVSSGAVFQLYRIGDSGSKAVWTGNFSQTSTSHGDGG